MAASANLSLAAILGDQVRICYRRPLILPMCLQCLDVPPMFPERVPGLSRVQRALCRKLTILQLDRIL